MPHDPKSSKTQLELRISRTCAASGWALLTIVLAASLWHLHVITRFYLPANHSDLLPVWSGTRAALAGMNPYSGDVVIRMQAPWYADAPKTIIHPEPQEFWYPGQAVVLFAPFASISWPAERLLYLTVVPPGLALIFWLATGFLEPRLSPSRRLIVVTLALFSWPVVWGTRLQQMSLIVAVMVLLSWYLIARGRQIAPGIPLAIATIKPQLVLPLLLWILIWAVARSRWRLIAAFSVTLAILIAIAERIMPGWIPHWVTAIHRYRAITHSSPQLELAFGHWVGLALGIAVLAVTSITFVRLRNCLPGSREFNLATALGLAVAVLISPFNPPIIYNYIFLLPALLFIIFNKPRTGVAAVIRTLLILQLTFDIFAPSISVIGESLTGPSSLWTVLPFLDFLLPSLATASLLLEVWTTAARLSRSQEQPVSGQHAKLKSNHGLSIR